MKNILHANAGIFVKRHPKATLVIDANGVYRLYADVNKRRPVIYHDKVDAISNYRRAIRLQAIHKICACQNCKKREGYSYNTITATTRQPGCIAQVRLDLQAK